LNPPFAGPPGAQPSSGSDTPGTIFLIFLRLGLTSFGGPVAHLAYFREEFVARRKWLDDASYADLVALCQFLPGPASSQVGLALGLSRGGQLGALAAWCGFTLPSALLLIAFALGLTRHAGFLTPEVIQGLKLVAAAVLVQALWSMGRTLCNDRIRFTLMALGCSTALAVPGVFAPVLAIGVAALLGSWLIPAAPGARPGGSPTFQVSVDRRLAWAAFGLFAALLLGLPILATLSDSAWLARFDLFYRSGALVFGGGHVVLPLLQAEVVETGLLAAEDFLAGYGATQAVPGPLFTFAAFLGTVMQGEPSGWVGGLWCLVAIFVPAYLLVLAALPAWQSIRTSAWAQSSLAAVNAAVVGLLLAALYDPVWTASVRSGFDFAFAVCAFAALAVWRLPQWLAVLAGSPLYALLAWSLAT
jgi:chromate transporter